MRRLITCTVLLALAAAAAGDARNRPHRKPRHPARHKLHAPPTPKIRAGRAEPLSVLPAAPAPDAPVRPATDPDPVVQAPAVVLPRTLGVSASEFRFALTRTAVGAGAVTIQFGNAGEDGHDLHVDALDGTPVAAWDELPAESAPVTRVVTLAAGSYRVYCSLPGHAAAGMDTRLTVS